MAQGKIPNKFGAGANSGLVVRALPEAAAAAYGATGTGPDRLVLLAKPHRAGAGHYVYMPVVVVPLRDLPEHHLRQVAAGAGEQGAGAGAAAAGTNADAPALLPGQLQLHPVVPGGRLRQLAAGAGSGTNKDAPIAGDEYSGRLILKAEEGGKAAYLNATTLQSLSDMMHGAADTDLGAFYDTAPDNGGDGDMPAPDNGVPIVELLLQLSDPDDLEFDYSKSPPEDAVPSVETLLDKARAAEQGARRYYDVLLPPPENLMPAVAGKASRGSLTPTYPVQVSVDAGAKAGDLIAGVGVKGAAGAEAGRGHGGLSALVGVVAASSAATALAAGAAGPATAFGLFALLVGGLFLAMASITVA